MSEHITELKPITSKEIADNGVQALADRPNATGQYGASGLSAKALKEWFDRLATLLAGRINNILQAYNTAEAAQHIPLDVESLGFTTLQDLLDGIKDGRLARKLVAVKDVTLDHVFSLVDDNAADINSLGAYLNNNPVEIVGFEIFNDGDFVGADGQPVLDIIAFSMNGQKHNFAVRISDIFKFVPEKSIGTGAIADSAVTADKIENGAITTEKIASRAITKDKIDARQINYSHLSTMLEADIKAAYNGCVGSLRYDASSGILRIDHPSGATIAQVDLPLETVVQSGYVDTDTKEIVLVLVNGEKIKIPVDFLTKKIIEELEAAERIRVAAEEERDRAESDRQLAEVERARAENGRYIAENARVDHENGRVSAETARQSAENVRTAAEAARESAEIARGTQFNAWRGIIEGVTQYDARIEENQLKADTAQQMTSRNGKRIANLERGLMADAFEVDDSVAYVKNVPANALPYAAVGKVGGFSVNDGGTMKSAKVTSIESVGVNRLDLSKAVNNALVANADGTYTFTKNGDSRFSAVFPLYIPAKTVVNGYMEIVSTNISNLTKISVRLRGANQATTGSTIAIVNGGQDYASNADAYYADMYLDGSLANGSYVTFRNPMITYGNGAKPYAPYAKHTLPIPEAVQALDGYGQGNPDDATEYNYIDFDTQEFVKKGAIVDGAWVRGESVTDVSNILSADNMIEVESEGTITAVNEHEYAVPSEITYQLTEKYNYYITFTEDVAYQIKDMNAYVELDGKRTDIVGGEKYYCNTCYISGDYNYNLSYDGDCEIDTDGGVYHEHYIEDFYYVKLTLQGNVTINHFELK